MEKIEPGKHVSLIYDLYAIDDNGEQTLVHQSDPSDPETFIFGVTPGLIQPLEKDIEGKQKGDEFNVVANSIEAFGNYEPDEIVELDKDLFCVDGKFDDKIVAVGKYVPMLTSEGFRINGKVLEITDDKVKLDFNHPLAGKTIRFKGSILEVRDATPEEIHLATSHGCGCGCHDDGCGCEGHDDGCGCEGHDHGCGCEGHDHGCGCH